VKQGLFCLAGLQTCQLRRFICHLVGCANALVHISELACYLQVFELNSFSVVHSFSLNSPILSFSVSRNRCIAVGLSDGKWCTLSHSGGEEAGTISSVLAFFALAKYCDEGRLRANPGIILVLLLRSN
jgi:hypothetical protein